MKKFECVLSTFFRNVFHLTISFHKKVLSHEAAHQIKQLGLENDLIDRIRGDPYFDRIKPELDSLLDPSSFIGRAPEQVDNFVGTWVKAALEDKEIQDAIGQNRKVELNV